MAALADGHRTFAPPVDVKQSEFLGQGRDNGVTIDRLRSQLDQAKGHERPKSSLECDGQKRNGPGRTPARFGLVWLVGDLTHQSIAYLAATAPAQRRWRVVTDLDSYEKSYMSFSLSKP
ncbi:MAG: hypothetical protein CM1200mP29_04180 [Verrucomicrobiota bacterium]|nr:MAG: hypothetical protein CM1200mP29_04180 [Verrucomicrobiota bacterium]